MKRGLFCVLLFLSLFSVYVSAEAESVALRIGESREINGVNFTLLRTNEADEKAVLCINNQKVIASETSTFGKAIVKVRDIFSNSATFDIEVACDKKCKCTEDCSNAACFASEVPPLLSCASDSDCDDNNPCTRDECNTVIARCVYQEIENCSIPGGPSEEEPQPTVAPTISSFELFTYVLLGIVVLLLVGLVVKRMIR